MLRAAARFSFPLWLQVIDEHSVMRLNNGTRAILRIYEVELCGIKIKPWLCSDWMEAVSWLRLMSRTAVKSCIIYCSDQKCGQIKLSCTVVHVCHRLAFVLSWAMPWKRCPGVLRTWNTFLEKEITSCFLAGPICVYCHPWKDTLGKDEDIWRYSICHICWHLNKFTSTLSLPCELPCIPWTMLWSSELPVSRLLKPASNNHSALAAVSTALLYCCLE